MRCQKHDAANQGGGQTINLDLLRYTWPLKEEKFVFLRLQYRSQWRIPELDHRQAFASYLCLKESHVQLQGLQIPG